MKNTVLAFAAGILIGRYIYINNDKKEAQRMEARIKRRLMDALEDLGLSKREITSRSNTILRR